MKSLTGRLLKASVQDPVSCVVTGAACSLPIIPLAVLATTVAIDAVAMPLGWIFSSPPPPPPDPFTEMHKRLDLAQQLALQIRDAEEREAYIAGIDQQRRKLLLAQAMGASLNPSGLDDQLRPQNL